MCYSTGHILPVNKYKKNGDVTIKQYFIVLGYRKIMQFFCVSQINYFGKLKSEANQRSALHQQIMIFCSTSSNKMLLLQDFNIIGHLRYINILTRLWGFQDKLIYLVLFSLFESLIWNQEPKGSLNNLQLWAESLKGMLEYWYIERGLLHNYYFCKQTWIQRCVHYEWSVFHELNTHMILNTL